MPRIVGVDIPKDKKILTALTYIYGVGFNASQEILKIANIDVDVRAKELTDEEVGRINNIISEQFKVEGDLRREVTANIKRLMSIGCYRGLRHRRGLPARGQRTKTNARTRKGPRRMVVGKKKK
ncbi:30S ribosomal protein S13 [bacterium]|nr:30S ribosomal protein S13 [bacterium]